MSLLVSANNNTMMIEMVNNLPSELIQSIIEFLDDRSRRSFALSCRLFQYLAIQVEKREFRNWLLIINSFLIQRMERRKYNNLTLEDEDEKLNETMEVMGIDSLYAQEFFKLFIVPSKHERKQEAIKEFHPSKSLWPVEEWTSQVNSEGKLVWTIGDGIAMCDSMVSWRKQFEHFKYWILRFRKDMFKDSAVNNLDFLNLMSLKSSLYKSITFVIKKDSEPFAFISKEIKSNRGFILKCVRRNPAIFKYLVDMYNNDLEIVQIVAQKHPAVIKVVSEKLRDNDSLARIVLPLDGMCIKEFSERIRGTLEFGLLAVSSFGSSLQYLHDDLKQNRDLVLEIVLQAVRNYGHNLILASDDLKRDREIVMTAVSQDPTAFGCLYKARDPDIIIHWGEDEELVLLSQNITFASERLRSCKSFVLRFIEINPNSFNYISPELMKDREVVLALVKRQGSMLEYVNTEYRSKPTTHDTEETISNRDIIMEAVNSEGYALRFASFEWRNTFEVVMKAVQNDGLALKYASNEMRDCAEIVIEAMKRDYNALEYVSHRLQVSPEIIELSQVLKGNSN
ncbi:Hypothetical protein NAEGRDRAFT_70806 [Naegleria gruberi]|uniref:F-box domain-containing protein n=1 Tax=Naegleria gruberi TaxID=5762 RepID=D2VPC5_NAEGR|nr:uncharacterized protein NAEGRDRAFT_70806 [Naegleria gruberi]EFC41409.1 Hypothetical protein NAEGRDRAFT_70806 [Naegleria gruberi]|eukprot:XP_002674153.1 Hypothetical protein NAEGRDRAFT_70806 [Naegleria gruberi strain NEG-M]